MQLKLMFPSGLGLGRKTDAHFEQLDHRDRDRHHSELSWISRFRMEGERDKKEEKNIETSPSDAMTEFCIRTHEHCCGTLRAMSGKYKLDSQLYLDNSIANKQIYYGHLSSLQTK